MRRLIGLTLAIAVLAGLAWALWPRPVPVDTAQIARQAIEVHVEEEGKSRIREVFTVSVPIAGRIQRLNLHAGDAVEAGRTVVASILPAPPTLLDARSRRMAEAAVKAASAAVDLATAQLTQAEAQRDFLQADLNRAEALLDREAISQRAYDKGRIDFLAAQAAVESAQAVLEVRQRELESARAALIESDPAAGAGCCTEVRAPASGRVLRVLIESEQTVQAGTPLLEIGDPSDIEIVVELLSADAVRVKEGAQAVIDGWGGAPLAARVQRIDPSAFTRVSALGIEEQRVIVVLALDGDPSSWHDLGDGYRVNARITVWKGENLLAIPIGALFRAGSDWATYVVADGRAILRRIELGERNAEFAEVRAGVGEGDSVILHPGDSIFDGARVVENPAP